jgi:Fe-S cluster biogenesis protein NfuA
VARQVVSDVVAPVAATHGGTVEVLDVRDGVVAVRMRGTCHGCPASSATLHGLLERELRRRLPGIADIRIAPEGPDVYAPNGPAGDPRRRVRLGLPRRHAAPR